MIEIGSIVELSNNKKYIMTDSSIENGSVYYLALEVDYQTEMPKEDSIFFKHGENNTLIPVTNDYLITNFTNDTTYGNFLNKVKGRSIYDFGVEVGVQDNILTLSTCYNNTEYRLVVHAKLMK